MPDLLSGLRLDELLREVQDRLTEVMATRDRMQGLLDAFLSVGTGWSWTSHCSVWSRPPWISSTPATGHSGPDPAAQKRIEEAVEDLDTTIREIRTAIFDLHSTESDSGLRRKLLDTAAEAAAGSVVSPSVRISGPIDTVVPRMWRPRGRRGARGDQQRRTAWSCRSGHPHRRRG